MRTSDAYVRDDFRGITQHLIKHMPDMNMTSH